VICHPTPRGQLGRRTAIIGPHNDALICVVVVAGDFREPNQNVSTARAAEVDDQWLIHGGDVNRLELLHETKIGSALAEHVTYYVAQPPAISCEFRIQLENSSLQRIRRESATIEHMFV
jgi:hypothetical protein